MGTLGTIRTPRGTVAVDAVGTPVIAGKPKALGTPRSVGVWGDPGPHSHG